MKRKYDMLRGITCAGTHSADNPSGNTCDIGGIGWIALSPYSPCTPVRCATCGEIWSLDWGGYTHETNMEAARNPELDHNFPEDATTCVNCGVSDYPTLTTHCTNKDGNIDMKTWLKAKNELEIKGREYVIAQQKLEKAERELNK